MKQIGSYEVKTQLARLLKDTDAKLAVAELRNWRKGISWGKGMNTRKAIEEGRC